MRPYISVVDVFGVARDGQLLARESSYTYYSRESDAPFAALTRIAGSGLPIDDSTGQVITVPGGDDDHSLWAHSDAYFGAAPALLLALHEPATHEDFFGPGIGLWLERVAIYETRPVAGLTRPDRPRLDEVQLHLTLGASRDASSQTSLNVTQRPDGSPKFISSFEGGTDEIGMRLASPWMDRIEADWPRFAPLLASPTWIDPEPWQ